MSFNEVTVNISVKKNVNFYYDLSRINIERLQVSFILYAPPTISIFNIQNVNKESIFTFMLNTKVINYFPI